MTEEQPVVLVDIRDGIAVVTLNRPQNMNAINLAMREELMRLASALDADKAVRVVVFTGAGEKAFCAGADLKERQSKSVDDLYDHRRQVNPRWVTAIASMHKPTIAAVNGYCLAGGLEIVLQCDLAIASDNAVFGSPEVSLGFIPAAGACQRLPRLVGIAKAKELILTARRFDAAEALEMGLVIRVVPRADVLQESIALARKIAAHPSVAVTQAKIALNASQETELSAGLRFENEVWLGCLLSDLWRDKLTRFAPRSDQ